MITNVTIRYASNISCKNEIAHFDSLGITGENISAVSWELKNIRRSDGTLTLIEEMVKKLSVTNDMVTIYIQLSGDQPDTRLIRYKKTGGLLKIRGYDVDFMSNKKDYIFNSGKGLTLAGTASFDISSLSKLLELIKDEKKIFFAIAPLGNNGLEMASIKSELEWMNNFWSLNGIVFLTLGLLDEMDCEVVALGKDTIIEVLK